MNDGQVRSKIMRVFGRGESRLYGVTIVYRWSGIKKVRYVMAPDFVEAMKILPLPNSEDPVESIEVEFHGKKSGTFLGFDPEVT